MTEKLKLHHTALRRGYISRRGNGFIEDYNGKFGHGKIAHRPNWKSTTYHIVEYWIATESNQ